MALLRILICGLLLGVINSSSDRESLLVETKNGFVQGTQYLWHNKDIVNAWRGIPFASPPTGDLRWHSPRNSEKWVSVLNCTELKSSCIQPDDSGSEDCLYLNVYSTANPTNEGPFPVLFYIYGGSLMSGAANFDYGGFLSHAGDGKGIIVVEVSYRLNILGFLTTKELSSEQNGVSGNYGIQDQIQALRWVQDNIASFNGDPNLVTICGQSSGGTSVFALLASPATKSLYHRAISLSGSPNITLSLHAAEKQNEHFIRDAGCVRATSAETLSCMRAKTPAELVQLIPEAWNTPHLFNLPMGVSGEHWEGLVIVDGVTITQPFDESLHLGDVTNNVPLMIGAMGQEPDEWPDVVVQDLSQTQWRKYLVDAFAPWDSVAGIDNNVTKVKVGDEVYKLYADESQDNPQKAFDSIVSDYGQNCANIQIAQRALPPHGRYNSDIYFFVNEYHLSHSFNTTAEYSVRYASHVYDLLMTMETWNAFDSELNGPYVPDQRDLDGSKLMQTLWYNFMLTGNPTPKEVSTMHTDDTQHHEISEWKAVDKTNDWPLSYNVYVIQSDGEGKQTNTVMNYNKEKCDYFHEIGVSQKQFWWCN